jgi:ADP-heptose:LPS heptosyltransferase
MTAPARSVLAVRADSLGDVLVTGPAIRALATEARVTVLASPIGAPAARALPGVARVLVHELPWILADAPPLDPVAMGRLVHDVRDLAPDEAVIFTSFHQSPLPLALLLRLAGVRRIAAISDDYPGSLVDVRHVVADDVHEVERALSLAAAAGHRLPAGDDRRLALRPLAPAPTPMPHPATRPVVVVHPGASVPARAYAPDRYRIVARRLARSGYPVVVTGGASERALTAFVAAGADHVHDLGGTTDFAVLARVIGDAAVVVCGNTGPAHLAAAVGTPVVSLYAPTVPASRWRPWGVPHVMLGDQDVPCRGCRARVCPRPDHTCLDVEPVAVVEAVEALLARVGTAVAS